MVNWKTGGPGKGRTPRWDAMIGRIGVVSHHLRSLLGAIKLNVLHVFVNGIKYFDVQIMETPLYKSGGLTYLPL